MKKFILFCAVFLFNFVAVAQTEDTPEDPETPINTQIIWLAIAGIAFAVYFFSKKRIKTA
jgi:hypothetical protein